MKSSFCTFIFLSGLFVSGYSEYSPAEPVAAATQEQQLEDAQILNVMITIDKGEIDASQKALKKEVSPPVDLYAKYLIQQHQKSLDTLSQLKKEIGLEPKESTLSRSLTSKGKHELENLEGIPSKTFDNAFVDAMVKDHQAGLEVIDTKLLPQVKNLQLKEAVTQFRTMVCEHLEKGLELQKALNAQKTSPV